MSLILSHTSALELYRSPYVLQTLPWITVDPRSSRIKQFRTAHPSKCKAPSSFDIKCAQKQLPFLSRPLNAIVNSPEKRRVLDDLVCHSNTTLGTVLPIGQDFFVVRPETLFVEAATFLSFIDLLQLGFELCGTYTASIQRPSFTNRIKIEKELASSSEKGNRGVKACRKALRFLIEKSASPRETALALLLSLPRTEGGYGLPKPQLNYHIHIPKTLQHRIKQRSLYCDLFWPDANLAVEYDSDAFHAYTQKIALDSSRRDILSYLGIEVISVTNYQISNIRELDQIAHTVAKKLGTTIRSEHRYNYFQRKIRLHRTLLMSPI